MVTGIEVGVVGVCVLAAAVGGYVFRQFLDRRKAKQDSKVYNADGTFNLNGLVDWFRASHPEADKVAAAVKAINDGVKGTPVEAPKA